MVDLPCRLRNMEGGIASDRSQLCSAKGDCRSVISGGCDVAYWGHQFFILKREQPKVFMQASFAPSTSPRPRHSSISFFDFQLLDPAQLSTLTTFVKELAQTFHADYAMAHILSQNELEDWLARRLETRTTSPAPLASQIVARLRTRISREGYAKVLWGAECLKLQTVNLQRCLPNLYWLNIFGPACAAMFGRRRLMEVPAASVETLAYGGTATQLTNDLEDSKEGWEIFKAVRAKCRNHLDSNVFCDSAMRRDHQYQTPTFFYADQIRHFGLTPRNQRARGNVHAHVSAQ